MALNSRVNEELSVKFAQENAIALSSIDAHFDDYGSLSEHFSTDPRLEVCDEARTVGGMAAT